MPSSLPQHVSCKGYSHALNRATWRLRPRGFAALLLCLGAVASPVQAQLSLPGASPSQAASVVSSEAAAELSPEEREAELRARIQALDTRIAAAEEDESQERADQIGISLAALQERTLSLRQLRSVCEDQLNALEQLQEVRRMRVDLVWPNECLLESGDNQLFTTRL